MEIRFCREPNVVFETAQLIYKFVNHVTYRDMRSYYSSKYQTEESLLEACFGTMSEAARKFRAVVSHDLPEATPYFKKNELGCCSAFYLLHDAMKGTHNDIYAAADAIKSISKAEFFLNFYSMLAMQDRKARFSGEVKNYNDLINFISSMHISEQQKWDLVYFYNNFETARSVIASIIFRAGEAYYQVYDELEGHLAHYVETMEKPLAEDGKKFLASNFGLALSDEIHSVTVVPSPVLCADSDYIYNFTDDAADDTLIVGCYFEPLGKISSDGERLRDLCGMLRTLGDPSKMKILKILLGGPRYGQELAGLLGISTATVSHHVSLLEEYGFIQVERRQSRVYYTLNRDQTNALLDQLSRELT